MQAKINKLKKKLKRLSIENENHLSDLELVLEKLITLSSQNQHLLCYLGLVKYALKKYEEAATLLEQNKDFGFRKAETLSCLHFSHKELGNYEAAWRYGKEACALDPKNSVHFHNLGVLHSQLGEFSDAERFYLKAIELDSYSGTYHRHLSNIKRYQDHNDKHLRLMLKLLNENNDNLENDPEIYIALGNAYKSIGNIKASFAYWKIGNNLKKAQEKYSFDHEEKVYKAIGAFYQLTKAQNVNISTAKLVPIFIVGMPRSGTTLLEQRLSRVKDIMPLGELPYIANFVNEYTSGEKPVTNDTLQALREEYLEKISSKSNGFRYCIDKMPANFRFIGCIKRAFPEAKIIHIKRQAEAVCWSNYVKYFTNDGLNYSWDLADIVRYYKWYENMMKFWQTEYPDGWLNVNYEQLTEATSEVEKNIFDYIGVSEDNVSAADPRRIINTASLQQVRQKIYAGSSQDWEKYSPYIGGAFDSLRVKRFNVLPR